MPLAASKAHFFLLESYVNLSVLHTYLIDHSQLGFFRANETNNWKKLTG